jgi:peptide deformylase
MLMKIVTYPDPVLRTPCPNVTNFDDGYIKVLIENMFETMYAAPGVGLAANQVGVSLNIFTLDVDFKFEKRPKANLDNTVGPGEEKVVVNANPRVFINAKIIRQWGAMLHEEGCLSVPGAWAEVQRSKCVEIEYQDMRGNRHTLVAGENEGEELLSRALQHEIDHLTGKLYIHRLSPLKREMLLKKWQKK